MKCQVSNIKTIRTEEFPLPNNPHEQIHMNREILCMQIQVSKISYNLHCLYNQGHLEICT